MVERTRATVCGQELGGPREQDMPENAVTLGTLEEWEIQMGEGVGDTDGKRSGKGHENRDEVGATDGYKANSAGWCGL